MKYRKELYAAAVCFLMALLCFAARLRINGEDLAGRIAPQLLRFHVLANSNSAADQALKVEVKNLLLEKLAEELEEDRANGASGWDAAGIKENTKANAGSQNRGGTSEGTKNHADGQNSGTSEGTKNHADSQNSGTSEGAENHADTQISEKERICRCVAAHRRELEAAAADFMAAKGYDYGAAIRVTRCYFPTKYYGDIVLPCGTYDAVQVTLGSGRGRNWWCLLYPRLCFIDATHAIVPEESKEELRGLVGEDDYAALLAQNGVKIHIRFKLFDLLADLLKTENADTPTLPLLRAGQVYCPVCPDIRIPLSAHS